MMRLIRVEGGVRLYLSVVTLKVCEHAPEGGLICLKLLSGNNAAPLPAASKKAIHLNMYAKCSVGMQCKSCLWRPCKWCGQG